MPNPFTTMPGSQRQAFIAAIVCLVTGLVLVLATIQSHHRQLNAQNSVWGEIYANQLALAANNALIDGDRLSLQALVNAASDHAMIQHAAIYNVDNQLLTEAGTVGDGPGYSGTITLQDSIAGYVVITLNQDVILAPLYSNAWQLLLLILLLSALVYLLSINAPEWLTSEPGAALQVPAHSALLCVHFHQPKQLDDQSLDGLAGTVNTLCELYDGQLLDSNDRGLTLLFRGADDQDNHPFRAVCSGHLLLRWLDSSDGQLRFGLGLALAGETGSNALTLAARARQTLLLSNECAEHPAMNGRIDLAPARSGQQLAGFVARYQGLLESQLTALQQSGATASEEPVLTAGNR